MLITDQRDPKPAQRENRHRRSQEHSLSVPRGSLTQPFQVEQQNMGNVVDALGLIVPKLTLPRTFVGLPVSNPRAADQDPCISWLLDSSPLRG